MTDNLPELLAKLRYMGKQYAAGQYARGGGVKKHYLEETADLLESERARADALQAELDLRRKSGSAVERLHNLCEGIAADADGSEFSREEWDRIDAENLDLRKRADALEAALREIVDRLANNTLFAAESGHWQRARSLLEKTTAAPKE